MKPNHKCDPARMALLYIRQQFICTTFKFDAYIRSSSFLLLSLREHDKTAYLFRQECSFIENTNLIQTSKINMM